MAPNLKKPEGFNGHVYCKRRNCPGVCPAKVVAHKYGTGKPARCRVCEQEYTLPPGAAELFPNSNKKQSPAETNQVKQLREQNARLKAQLDKQKEADSETKAKGAEDEATKQNVKGLQAAFDQLQKSGATKELLASLEKELKAAKEAAKPKAGGDPCKIILGKLTAAKNRKKQLEDQYKKDLEKLSATKLKLVEVTKEVLVTEKQKDALFKEHGHTHAKVDTLFSPPKGCTPLQAMQWVSFCESQQQAMQKFFGEVFTHPGEETKPQQVPGQPEETWEGCPYSATPMGVDSEVEIQGRAKLLRGADSQQVVTDLGVAAAAPTAGHVGLQIATIESKSTNSKRGWASMEEANAPGTSSHGTQPAINGGTVESDEDAELAREAEAAVAAFEKQAQNPSNEEVSAGGDDDL